MYKSTWIFYYVETGYLKPIESDRVFKCIKKPYLKGF
jgi:hypothetical protein